MFFCVELKAQNKKNTEFLKEYYALKVAQWIGNQLYQFTIGA